MATFTEIPIISTFVQALLFGLYISTFLHALRWLVFLDEGWALRSHINWSLLIITCMIFVLMAGDLGYSFLYPIPGLKEDEREIDIFVLITVTIENLVVVLADSVLIYRCWAVYGKNWHIVCIPLLLWLGGICSLIAYIGVFSSTVMNWPPTAAKYATADLLTEVFYVITIILNIYATCCKTSTWSKHVFRFVTRVIAESGLLYTFTSILLLITFILSAISWEDYLLVEEVCSAVNFSMLGVAFNLIIIRVAKQRVSTEMVEESESHFEPPKKSHTRLRIAEGRHDEHDSLITSDVEDVTDTE
ncbi:hypothetical protein AMATHDRAFT_6371 [Amanita thiersii Skay4041]|uniref:Uncharacterized protein n=1 Tax=Amanita thiersii Skay4041 TaxID=703135 RepID=A0A2A9NCN4_9AGAR|nr:hypothetical protein AMATHDRAFT_6371 [Amanita thiersii Skay4041]